MSKIKELPVRKVIEVLKISLEIFKPQKYLDFWCLNKFGFKFLRKGKPDVYYNDKRNITVPVPTSHGIITRGVIQSLIKQTGIPREEFFP